MILHFCKASGRHVERCCQCNPRLKYFRTTGENIGTQLCLTSALSSFRRIKFLYLSVNVLFQKALCRHDETNEPPHLSGPVRGVVNGAIAQGPMALHGSRLLQNSSQKITNFSLSAIPYSYPFYASLSYQTMHSSKHICFVICIKKPHTKTLHQVPLFFSGRPYHLSYSSCSLQPTPKVPS